MAQALIHVLVLTEQQRKALLCALAFGEPDLPDNDLTDGKNELLNPTGTISFKERRG